MIQLRPHQSAAVEALLAVEGRFAHAEICVSGGKSLVMADLARRVPGRVLILAHTSELVKQNIEACSQVGLFAAPCAREVGVNLFARVTVGTIQTVVRRLPHFLNVERILVDECFPAGTLVDAPQGKIPIERIRPGDVVFNALGVGYVEATSCRVAKTIEVELTDGSRFECTENHPIFTSDGWVCAGSLAVGERVFCREDVRELRGRVSPMGKEGDGRNHSKSYGSETVGEAAFLLNLMLEAPRERHEATGRSREGVQNTETDGPQAKGPRRKWSRADEASKAVIGAFGRGLDSRVCDLDSGRPLVGIPYEPQSRPCKPEFTRGDRTGRQESCSKAPSAARREERPVSDIVRVARVSRQKRGCAVPVFNLQVSGHPSYYAGGILVHNCHLIAPDERSMYRRLFATLSNAKISGVTGTPYRADGTGSLEDSFGPCVFRFRFGEALALGYVKPLRQIDAEADDIDVAGVKVSHGEWATDEIAHRGIALAPIHAKAAIRALREERRSRTLVFACDIEHANVLAREFNTAAGRRVAASCHSKLDKAESDELIKAFREGRLPIMTSVQKFTTGFSVTEIDSLVLARPVRSRIYYEQGLGRGARKTPVAYDCAVIDFGGNVARHGSLDMIKPIERRELKTEREREEAQKSAFKTCKACGHEYAEFFDSCPHCGYDPRINRSVGTDLSLRSKARAMLEQARMQPLWLEVKGHPIRTPNKHWAIPLDGGRAIWWPLSLPAMPHHVYVEWTARYGFVAQGIIDSEGKMHQP